MAAAIKINRIKTAVLYVLVGKGTAQKMLIATAIVEQGNLSFGEKIISFTPYLMLLLGSWIVLRESELKTLNLSPQNTDHEIANYK